MGNRWWDRGYTWKTLAGTSVAFLVFTLVSAFLRLVVEKSGSWWFVVPVVLVAVSIGWAWRARRLYLFEKGTSTPRPPDESC